MKRAPKKSSQKVRARPRERRCEARIGILAYGSLIDDPGDEIKSATLESLTGVTTPFAVEYTRKSRGRGEAPTLVPVQRDGAQVKAVILVLRADVSKKEATDMLWRRETDQVGSGRSYKPTDKPGPDTVVVRRLKNFCGIDLVLYTEIAPNIDPLTSQNLAELAIKSAISKHAVKLRDGISYLIAAKRNGIVTPLSPEYEEEILRSTGSTNLQEAFKVVRK